MKFLGIAAMIAALGACGQTVQTYVRPSSGCNCAGITGKTCRCNHCIGENNGQAKCYCGDKAGCQCGLKRPSCDCGHCSGMPGGMDGNGGCTCPK